MCDKTEPRCQKCQKKGIDCSGLGVRYRFADGLASRRKAGHGKGFQLINGCETQKKTALSSVPSQNGDLRVTTLVCSNTKPTGHHNASVSPPFQSDVYKGVVRFNSEKSRRRAARFKENPVNWISNDDLNYYATILYPTIDSLSVRKQMLLGHCKSSTWAFSANS